MSRGAHPFHLNTGAGSPRSLPAARGRHSVSPARQTLSNARATTLVFPPRPKRAGAGPARTVVASPEPQTRSDRTRANASGLISQSSSSSYGLVQPIQQQAHSEGVLLGRALHQAWAAFRPLGRFDLCLPARNQVRPGPQELRVRRYLVVHRSGLQNAPSVEVIPL